MVHNIRYRGIKMDESQIQSISEALVPTDKKSLQSFLGLVGYFSMYVPNFAHVVEPRGDIKILLLHLVTFCKG